MMRRVETWRRVDETNASNFFFLFSPASSGVWGRERQELLLPAKIQHHPGMEDGHLMPIFQLDFPLQCCLLIVSLSKMIILE